MTPSMRMTLKVDHTGLERQPEPTEAAAQGQVFHAERPPPGIVLDSGPDLRRDRGIAGGRRHWMVAVRMKLDSLEDCCSR